MPMMMYNGVPYGSLGVEIISLTYAEYEALTEAQKMDASKVYDITDMAGGVVFGSTDISKIGDGTVTGAIGAINSNLNEAHKSYNHNGSWIQDYPCGYTHQDATSIGTIVISLGINAMFSMYLDVWSYWYRGMIHISAYSYSDIHSWYEARAFGLGQLYGVPIHFARDTSGSRYILLGNATFDWGSYLAAHVTKVISHYRDIGNVSMSFIPDVSSLGLTIDKTVTL